MPNDMEYDRVQAELEEPGHRENWDWENPVIREGRPSRGSTFSVRFRLGELDALKRFAEAHNMTTGEFIRNAALSVMRGTATAPEDAFAVVGRYADAAGRAIAVFPSGEFAPLETTHPSDPNPATDGDTIHRAS